MVWFTERQISKNGERFLKLYFPGRKPFHPKQGRTTNSEAEELTVLDKECIPYIHMCMQVYIYILYYILSAARGHYIISDLRERDVHTHCPCGASALHAETHRSSGTGTHAWSAALSPAAGAARCAHPWPWWRGPESPDSLGILSLQLNHEQYSMCAALRFQVSSLNQGIV